MKFYNAETHGIAEQNKIWTKGEYGYVHWSQDREGEGLLASGALAGRPDLQAWLRDRRDAFDSLLEKYSGDNLAKPEDTSRTLFQSDNAGRRGADDPPTGERLDGTV